MKYLIVFGFVISTALLAGCTEHASKPEAETGVEFIRLSRTTCFGMCPVYTVEVSSKGVVHYEGELFVHQEGERSGSIEIKEVSDLGQEIIAAGFMDLTQEEVDECPEEWTDHPTAILTVRIDGRTKRISHYDGCEGSTLYDRLTKLEDRVDEVLQTAKWIEKP
jgi:hypothetical protein